MNKAKGRTIRIGLAFLALGVATLGVSLGSMAARADDAPKTPAKAPARVAPAHSGAHHQQRARLPRRLAADFHKHIDSRLPDLRPSFEAAARETGIDWRLLAALGYQESKWRSAAVSPRGAQGVMMLMPVTVTKMGVKDVFHPDDNILGGSRYLAYLKERIPRRIMEPDRTLMAMAAYNMGIGHLEDARIITQMRKKSPDSWPNVRANLHRLSDPAWHTRVKRGYANGRETAQLVERVTQFAAILETRFPEAIVAKE
jgi:membrane-bound lytic murein transglycosylase F